MTQRSSALEVYFYATSSGNEPVKEALTSGGSTAKSNEYFCSKYNGMNVCIDDVKGETLASSNFTALVKGVYKGVPRTKMLPYGKGVEYINTCSPLAYLTNESSDTLLK